DPLSPRGRVSLPQWTGKDLFAFSTQAGLEVRRIELKDSALTLVAVERQEISFSRWSTDALEKYDSAKVTRVRPFRQARTILNSAWSPSNKVSAVEFSGRPSLYAIARDGKSPLLIDAKGESPCWLNDNYIVYMVTEDDGHRILSGNIWIADKEGKMKKNLTEGFGEIALYPSAALDGTIVFTTEGGAVYKMRIAVE
ncbi:MAG: TolB family protein, partial [Bacteroidota bacterium]